MRFKVTLLVILLFIPLMAGCGKKNNGTATTSPSPAPTTAATTAPVATTAPTTAAATTPTKAATDVVTTASIVNQPDAFIKAISNTGTWIIAILQDMTINQDLVLDGEFKNGKKDDAGKDIIQRKLAFYSQDANRTITARYTLTAPKLTINSPMASIQHGTFKGDLYVNDPTFQLIDATVDGNIYFKNADVQKGFKMDATSKVTGQQKLQ